MADNNGTPAAWSTALVGQDSSAQRASWSSTLTEDTPASSGRAAWSSTLAGDLAAPSPVNGQAPSAPKFDYQDSSKPWYERAWSWANTPLTSSLFGMPEEREGAGGFERGAEHIIAGLTSPLSIALGAATFGTGSLLTSAGETALKEAALETGGRAFSDEAIAQIAKGSQAALKAVHGIPDIEPLIQGTLGVGGHDLGLLQKARQFFGPVSHDLELAEPEFQKILSHAGLNPQQIEALGKGAISAEEREALAAANGGFTTPELKELARTGKAIKGVWEGSDPVRKAVQEAGVEWDTYKRGYDFLDSKGLDPAALLGGDLIDRGAFQVLHHVAPDLSLGTTLKAARTAKTLMNTGFTLQQLEGAAAMSPRFFDALKEGDYDKAAEYGTEWAANAVLGVAGASHALHAWGELAEPILGAKLKPSDEQLRVNNLSGVREAEHAVGDQQGINVLKETIRFLGHDPDKLFTMSKEERAVLDDKLGALQMAIELGKDPELADAYRTWLKRAQTPGGEARPVNGLPTGQPLSPTEVPSKAGTQVVFFNDKGEVRVGADRRPIVWMSPEAWTDMEDIVGHKFSGVNYASKDIADLLLNEKIKPAMVELIKAAQEASKKGALTTVKPGSGIQVVGEELHHAWQRELSHDQDIVNHLDGATRLNGNLEIVNGSPWDRLHGIIPKGQTESMDRWGYAPDPVTRVAETAAKFRAGRIPKGVTPDEAMNWLSEYEKEVKAKHGEDSYEPAERINEIARQHLEDINAAKARSNPADQGTGSRVVGGSQEGAEGVQGVVPEERGGVRGKPPEGLEARYRQHEEGELIDYQRARDIFRATLPPEAAKDAIGQAYGITGGNKWLTREELDRIGRSALDKYPQGLTAREVEGEPFDVTSSNLYKLGGVTEAVKRLSSRTQKLAEKLSEDLSARLKIKSSGTGSIGHWEGGAEPSTFTEFPPGTDPDAIAYRMAIMAKAQRQNTGIHFDPNPKGPDVAFQFRVPSSVANPNEIARLLEEHHISGSTIKPIAGGHNVIITSPKGELRGPVSELANRLKATEVKEHNGTQTTLGDWNDRNAASTLYDARIRGLEAAHPEWSKVRTEFESSPDYATLSKLIREAEDKVKTDENARPFLQGVHGSRTANISELNPEMQGKGPQGGAEMARAKNFPEDFVKRSYLRLEGSHNEPFYERLPYQYRAVLNSENLYNWAQDRDGLLPKAEKEAAVRKMDTQPGAVGTIYERMMRDAGYDGYYHPGHNQIGVFKNTPVEKALSEGTHPFSPKPEPRTVGTATGAKADTDFFAKAKTELGTDNISAIARRAQELKEAARPVNGLFSKEPEKNLAPTWYLKSNQLVDSRMQGPMPADTVLKMLENNGVKPDELKYTGLSDFLREKGKEPVRPEELREYLAANNLQIKEVTKGGPYQTYGENGETKFESYTLPGAKPESYRELLFTLPEDNPKIQRIKNQINEITELPSAQTTWNGEDRTAAYDRLRKELTDAGGGYGSKGSSQFQSPHWDEINPVGHVRFNDRTGPNGEKLLHVEELQSDWHQKGRKEGYTEPVSPEQIKAAEVRMKNAEPAAFEALRKNDNLGFDTIGEARRAIREHADWATRWDVRDPKDIAAIEPLRVASQDLINLRNKSKSVPDAPFKKTWPEFLFKRMVRYAAENGYDGISWTPGEEQAARYDLSKQVKNIKTSKAADGGYIVQADLVGGGYHNFGTIPEDKLADHVGKDLATRIINDTSAPDAKPFEVRNYHGADLKVGGEGMKGFYDKIVPDLANKLGKQFGAKVGETKIGPTGMAKLKYEGPDYDISDVRSRIKNSRNSSWDVQLQNIANAMSEGKSFREAFAVEGSEMLAENLGGKAEWFQSGENTKVPYFPVTDSLRESVLKQGQPLFAREGRPQNGLPEGIEGMLQDNEFAKRSPEYQQKIIRWLDMIAENKLPDHINKAYKYATAEDGKNWEIANRNGMMDEFTDNHVHRKYQKNEEGNVVVSDAKAGKFATNTTGARRRAYDTLMTALLKSPDEIKFNPAEAISKDRTEVVKAAANRKFVSQLMSSGLRASDGRPVAYLNGAGNVVAGEDGKDPKTFVDPNRIRKINIDDKTVQHLTQSGDLQRFIDDGTIRDITPYVRPDNIGAAIDRLAKEALKSIDYTKYGEQGNNILLSQIERLKEMQKTGDYSGLKELNDMQQKSYAWSPQGYVALDHNAMRGWNFVTNSPDGNSVLVNSDIMTHPEYAQYLKNRLGLEKGALSGNPVGKAILGAGKAAKETLLSLSPFHLVQIGLRGIMTGVNPFTLEGPDIEHGAKINPADPNSPTKIKKMVEQGLTTGRDYKSMQEYTEGNAATGEHNLLRRVPVVGPILADSMQFQTDFLFKRFLPAIKATAAEKLFDDYQAKYPEWSTDKIARAAASHANDSFGGVNWRAMGRNATTQEFARAVLLAPDWLESELRSGARLFNKDEGAIGRRQVVIMAGSVYLMARALNAMTTGNPHYEAPFSLATQSKDGKETLWGIRMLPSDLLHAASTPGEFLKGRLSPGVGLTQELLSGRDKMGRKLQPQDLWADATRQLLPIPVQSIGQAITNTGPQVGNAGQVWKAAGGTARTYSSPAQQKAVELASTHNPDGFVDPVQQARHRTVMELEDRLRSGDVTWPDLVKMVYTTDQLKEAELKKIQNNYKSTQGLPADIAHLYSRAARLPAKEFLDVWDTANITEQKALHPLLLHAQKTYLRKAAKDMTPAERQADPTFQRLLNMAMGTGAAAPPAATVQ